MKAFQVVELGAPPELREIATPEPGAGEVLVEVASCGLNFGDLLMAKGEYQEKKPTPFTMGMEAAGTVRALGPGVSGPPVGTRVACMGGTGAMAEYGAFPADRCVPIPEAMSFDEAAAFQVAYGTSHVALDYRAQLKPGETLLVLGAAGGVGLTAIEIGKLMGARVIACARGAAKLDICKAAGADHVIDSESEDLREAVKALGGCDVVYDPVGGDQFTAAFRACNPEARILVIGFASGGVPQIKANHLLVKNIQVIGFYWGGYMAFKPEVIGNSMRALLGWYDEGKLHPHVSHTAPLAETGAALDFLAARKSTGKVVVNP